MHACMHECMYVCMYVYVCVVYVLVCMYVCTYTSMCMYDYNYSEHNNGICIVLSIIITFIIDSEITNRINSLCSSSSPTGSVFSLFFNFPP